MHFTISIIIIFALCINLGLTSGEGKPKPQWEIEWDAQQAFMKNRAEFFKAVSENNVGAATSMLAKKTVAVDVKEGKYPFETALFFAPSAEMAELLVHNGAKVNEPCAFGTTPLISAVRAQRYDVVKTLFAHGADVNQKGHNGHSVLHEVKDGDVEMAELLIAKHPDLNARETFFGKTPLMEAATRGDVAMVNFLLEHKAEVDAVDFSGETALFYAVNRDVVNILVAKGAKVDARTTEGGKTSVLNPAGKTPLMAASLRGNEEVVRALLAKGADVNAQNKARNPETALDLVMAKKEKYPKSKTWDGVKAALENRARELKVSGEQGGR